MRMVFLLCLGVCLFAVQEVQAMIFIEEILADPPALVGDANGDGVISATQDEFIEIFNDADSSVFLSGWTLADSVRPRHLFPAGSIINGRETLVVFGGGNPILSSINWQTASSGTLGLNNDGDNVILKDGLGTLIDQVNYGAEGGKDESLTRDPNDLSRFILHSQADLALQRRYSPGETLRIPEPVIEEPPPVEPPAENPVEEEPIVEDPPYEDPVQEEPSTEDSVQQDPVVEEPVYLPSDHESHEEFPSTSAVPEPATIICLASGMAAALWLKRRDPVTI